MDTQEIVRRLNLRGKALSKGHRRIAAFIAEHSEKAAFMTAVTLGQSCGVSESTVVRFATAMGYEGYPELQAALQELVRQRLTASERFNIASEIKENDVLRTVLKNDMRNIRLTTEDLSQRDFDSAVELLLFARRIYVMGLRSAAPLAQFFGHYLRLIFDDVVMVQNAIGEVFDEMERIGPRDVLVGISFPRYSTRTVECMRIARENGAEVIAVTDGAMSPLSAVADICLYAHTDMASFVDSLAAPLSLLNALIVALSLRRRDELSSHLKRLENLWKAHGVYLDREDARPSEESTANE
ncbi:MAG: MurR/RpiR family transcriptional regulator [Eubacteriales bacterium]|nr:MurR/RpiR family transcriptional regulator [Eubacteriales bacterium]